VSHITRTLHLDWCIMTLLVLVQLFYLIRHFKRITGCL